ncbi:transposase [Burkholderia stagnalis]|uniref:ATP-binding protein n=1 Tax=Burkholderia stagnalis TaxID=1503054 RepID=UPI00075F9C6A|nr:ATP-binding protein [Burkholderia stagnalis]KWK49967.1 transposase [Burkholderia stagnalis]KWK57748.1 transposase [Burkholderia stagnalis]
MITTEAKKVARPDRVATRTPVRQCEQFVEAEYYQGDLPPEYKSNPLISALGPLWDSKSIMRALSVPVAWSASECLRSDEYRLHVIGRLSRLVVPVPASLQVANLMQTIIRQNYVGQSPVVESFEEIGDRYKSSQNGELVPINEHTRSHAYCAGIFGLSGSGKSTVLEDALRLMPKVIKHSKYGLMQVVAIKVDCPTSASLKDTIKSIIGSYDELLGTRYLDELRSGATVADCANKLYRIARRHRTGLIILDELQNALRAISRTDPLFDFFVGFANCGGSSVIGSGTPNARGLFRKTLRSARRISSRGVIEWNGMANAADWEKFCDQLEKYQWLKNMGPLSFSIRGKLYEVSQGLPGIVIPLYQLAQENAIYTGIEKITREILVDVYSEYMETLRPIVSAIESKDKSKMSQYEDLLGDTLSDIVATMEGEAKRHMYAESAIQHDQEESAIDAVSRLLLLGISEDVASSLINTVQKEFPAASAEKLSDEAARRYYLR